MNDPYILSAVAVIALVTAATRFLPFLIWSGDRKTPPIIHKLSRSLPYAIMGMLVVYCLKGIGFRAAGDWLPALISCAAVVLSYLWKRNTLLSILLGTLCHMLLVQLVF